MEPDPHILDWTADLAECNAAVAAALPDDHRRSVSPNLTREAPLIGSLPLRLIFLGIADLVDQLLITCARAARYVTPQGVQKIRRNMLAVQQALCAVVEDASRADLPRARAYWALYEMGPKVGCRLCPTCSVLIQLVIAGHARELADGQASLHV